MQLWRQQVKHGGTALWVTGRSDVSHGFVQEYIDVPGRGSYGFSIDTHFVMLGVNPGTLGGYGKTMLQMRISARAVPSPVKMVCSCVKWAVRGEAANCPFDTTEV